MNNAVSEMIGQAVFGDGTKGKAYRALRPLLCASCPRLIAEGEMFTRAPLAGRGFRLWPRCAACIPFALESGQQTRSALLNFLLAAPEREGPAVAADKLPATAQTTPDRRREIDEAMQRRLGPALQRTQRRRPGKH